MSKKTDLPKYSLKTKLSKKMVDVIMHFAFKYENFALVHSALNEKEYVSDNAIASINGVQEILKDNGLKVFNIQDDPDVCFFKRKKSPEFIIIHDKNGKELTISEVKIKYLLPKVKFTTVAKGEH